MLFRSILAAALTLGVYGAANGQSPDPSTNSRIESLEKEVETLKRQVEALQGNGQPQSSAAVSEPVDEILAPDLGSDERENPLGSKPEIFLQTRFSKLLVKGAAEGEADQNFQMTRIEARWAGRLSPRWGAGLELQFHPALEGAPEEIVNDAFMEFYASREVTIRAGQFIKPFGFDIQQSSADREYPERAMFAGYFFPEICGDCITLRPRLCASGRVIHVQWSVRSGRDWCRMSSSRSLSARITSTST